MQVDNNLFMRRVVILCALSLALVICLTVYGRRSNAFKQALSSTASSPTLTNPEVLQNWLPASSYTYTLARIDNYLASDSITATSMKVQGDVSVSALRVYDFTLLLVPQEKTYSVEVAVSNFNSIISTSVSIDGNQQGYVVPTTSSGPTSTAPTQFTGINELVNQGLSAVQANALQTAFQKFAPAAGSVSVNTSSIKAVYSNSSSASTTFTLAYTVTIDGKQYNATIDAIGLTSVELLLTNQQTNQQVFDSGVITQN